MSDTTATPIEYASESRRDAERLTGTDYLLQVAAVATLVGVVVVPLVNVGRYKKFYVDYGLKLPTSTQLLLDTHDVLVSARAQYWVWVLPALAPLLLSRVTARSRNRLLLVAVCVVGLASVYCSTAVIEPMTSLLSGLTTGGRGGP